MSDLTRNLVDAIVSGKATAIEDSFQAAMSDKISSAMEARKVVLAQGLFRESVEEELTLETDSTTKGKVVDRVTGKEYDPEEEFKKFLNSPKTKAALKRMKDEKGHGWPKSKSFDSQKEDYSIDELEDLLEDYMMSEEFEQLDELSKKTLGSYVKKASQDNANRGINVGSELTRGETKKGSASMTKLFKRDKNISKAVDKMTKEEFTLEDYSIDELEDFMMSEEFEQLDELSRKTLGSYVTKAHDQLMAHTAAVNMKTGRGDKDAFAYSHDTDTMRKEKNRKKGLSQAVGKLTKEEVELDEANEIFHQEIGDNHYRVMMNGKTHSTYKGQDAKLKAQAKVKKLKAVKEEVELDEVSQGTLDSYRKKSFDEPGEKREAGRKLAFAKSTGTSGDAKVSATEFVTKAKSEIKDLIKPEHHAKYPISKITGYNAAHKIYKDASAAGHLKEEVEELDD